MKNPQKIRNYYLERKSPIDDLYLILEDGNLSVYRDSNNNLNLSIESYNFNLQDEQSYVKSIFSEIVRLKQDILDLFGADQFILSIDGYYIDELKETNSDLINTDSTVTSIRLYL